MRIFLILLLASLHSLIFPQQISDRKYNPTIENPAYEKGAGPIVFIDEGHHNFHTKNGRYKAFSTVLERDGYKVLAYKGAFNRNILDKGKILVISNALNEMNLTKWHLPTPSAFTPEEIAILRQWVNSGGSLFLIADHMPMGGAASDLAAVFGFEFTNGFAFDSLSNGNEIFSLKEGTLVESIITEGRNASEQVKQIVTFTGQAFRIPDDATPVLVFPENHVNLMPDTAWVFNDNTRIEDIEGWKQGAYKKHGKGRVVVFGEAAMFTAQLAGPNQIKVGMNSTEAKENYQLLLNIIHWLDGKLD
ncbi:hypothetical protein ACFLT1_05075 [Bacteroidota bacterium]